jgi:hypothetical protein
VDVQRVIVGLGEVLWDIFGRRKHLGGGNLDRVQVGKGWLDATGKTQEKSKR